MIAVPSSMAAECELQIARLKLEIDAVDGIAIVAVSGRQRVHVSK